MPSLSRHNLTEHEDLGSDSEGEGSLNDPRPAKKLRSETVSRAHKKWSKEEQHLFDEVFDEFGCDWTKYSTRIPGRDAKSCRSYYLRCIWRLKQNSYRTQDVAAAPAKRENRSTARADAFARTSGEALEKDMESAADDANDEMERLAKATDTANVNRENGNSNNDRRHQQNDKESSNHNVSDLVQLIFAQEEAREKREKRREERRERKEARERQQTQAMMMQMAATVISQLAGVFSGRIDPNAPTPGIPIAAAAPPANAGSDLDSSSSSSDSEFSPGAKREKKRQLIAYKRVRRSSR
jgi:hypothetical protein